MDTGSLCCSVRSRPPPVSSWRLLRSRIVTGAGGTRASLRAPSGSRGGSVSRAVRRTRTSRWLEHSSISPEGPRTWLSGPFGTFHQRTYNRHTLVRIPGLHVGSASSDWPRPEKGRFPKEPPPLWVGHYVRRISLATTSSPTAPSTTRHRSDNDRQGWPHASSRQRDQGAGEGFVERVNGSAPTGQASVR